MLTPVSMWVTVERSMTSMPCRLSSRVRVTPARRSHPESTRSLRISIVTLHPAAFHMEANSAAIAPAPMMTALCGIAIDIARVESMIAPRNGSPGSCRGTDPMASTTS